MDNTSTNTPNIIPFCSIVIPCYNESTQIFSTLSTIKEYMDSKNYKWEIIVVNDGSEDNTRKIVSSFSLTEPRVKIIKTAACPKRNIIVNFRCRDSFNL